MLEWFSAHPVLTILLILLITSRFWLGPLLVIGTLVGTALAAAVLGVLYGIICVWEWLDRRVRRLRRRR